MDVVTFFLAPYGRLRRRDAWLALLVLVVATALVAYPLVQLVGGRFASLIVNAALVWPIAAVGAKRLRDRGKRAWPWLALYLGPAVLLTILEHLSLGYYWRGAIAHPEGLWPNLLSLFATVVGVFGLFENLMMPGQAGRNEYGSDPRIATG